MFKLIKSFCLIFIIVILIFELLYRFYVVDFYKAELEGLNKERLSQKNIDYLVFGDSFTVLDKYIQYLEKKSTKKFINASSSGIGIDEINLFASSRIKKFKPKNIIYQVYVGNDLLDVKNLTNFKKLSLTRNIYWWFSDYFISFLYLNKRFSFKKSNFKRTFIFDDSYHAEKYSKRSKLYFLTDSLYLQKSILIQDDFVSRYNQWLGKIKTFINTCNDIPIFIVFIPHNVQLGEKYMNRMEEIGGDFTNKYDVLKDDYAFYLNAVEDLKSYKNVTVLNPLRYFKNKDSIKPLYYANDPHLNDFGQQVLGEYLEKQIMNK